MKISGVYKIQSIVKPERCYIGSAAIIGIRWGVHLKQLRKGIHHSKKLQRHYNKYGESDLQFSILLGCDNKDLLKAEQYFLDSYPSYFNNYKTAGSPLGYKFSNETRRKMSESALKRPPMSEENRQKHRRPCSAETKLKISIANKGNKIRLGKRHSEETKLKISKSQRGKIRTEEVRKKLSIAHLGKNKGEKNSFFGKHHTEESKAKRLKTIELKKLKLA